MSPRGNLAQAGTAILTEKIRRSREDFHEYMEFAVRNETGKALRQAVLHRVWYIHITSCWAAGRHPCILGPWGHGKCQTVGSPVQMADGSVKAIEDVSNEDVLAFDPESLSYRPRRARSFCNGEEETLRFTLWSGRVIEVTKNHPLWTVNGWQRAEQLEVGKHVGVVRRMPSLGKKALRENEAALIGFLVGDGGLSNGVSFTSGEPLIIEKIKDISDRFLFDPVDLPPRNGCPMIRINGARPWARRMGLLGRTSKTKVTPPCIFTAPNQDVAEYLGAYFTCDGTVRSTRGGVVELYSVNRALLDDAQSLLLRFGIRSRIRVKRGRYWRLTITGAGNLKRFREEIPLWGKKACQLEALERAALTEGNDRLLALTADTVSWERIVDIEQLGKMRTYGLEVDDLHSYVSGDIISHNSVELAIGLPSWLVGQDPTLRIKVVSNNDRRARERIMGIGAVIRSPHYKLVFPDIHEVTPEKARRTGQQSKWTQHELYVDRPGFSIDPTFQGAGVMSGGIGGRADLLVLDDIVDQKNALDEPTMREKVIQNVDNVWMSRLEPDGRIIMVSTPWHEADFTHVVLERPAWSVLRIWVSDDFSRLDMEVTNPPPGYPLPKLERAVERANGSACSMI